MSSEAETKYCSNCKKDIAATNFTMHEAHCQRHLVLCKHCEEPIPRTEMDQHFSDVHAKISCAQCAKELEKDQLDNHLEKLCPKRQVPCEYCELQMPQSDLASHVEFCGTRTEICRHCGSFVMHKDLLRHESSNCTYPEAKPSNNTNGFHEYQNSGDDENFTINRDFGEFFGNGPLHPFEFEEIRRALEGDADEHRLPDFVAEDSDASAAAGEMSHGRRGRSVGEKSVLPGLKKNNIASDSSKVTNRRSEINQQRERASSPTIPPDIDYDTMLAMQLALENEETESDHEPDPDAHLNQLLHKFENRIHPQVQEHFPMDEDVSIPASSPPSYDDIAAADEDMIPCEFCGETFPAYTLVPHQSVCDSMAPELWNEIQHMPPTSGRNNQLAFHNHWSPLVPRPPSIPVINNLGSVSPVQEQEEEVSHHLTDNGDHLLNSLENIMLPCEFCNELLPADSLVQHQATCETNRLTTPEVMTPAASQPSSGISSNSRPNQFFPTSPSSTPRRHQQDTDDIWTAVRHKGQENELGNVRPKKRPNALRVSSHSEKNPGMSALEFQPFASQALQARGGSVKKREEEEPNFSLQRRIKGTKRNQSHLDNASRTRRTLDSLLSEDVNDQGLAGAVSVEDKSQSKFSQGSPRRTLGQGAATTGVSSRTVMRSLQQDKKQKPQARNETTTQGEVGSTVRFSQRERGDHVFNSPSHSRNSVSQARSKKSSNKQLPEWS